MNLQAVLTQLCCVSPAAGSRSDSRHGKLHVATPLRQRARQSADERERERVSL